VSITDKKVSRRARVTEVHEILLHPGNKITIPTRAKKPKARKDPSHVKLEAMLKQHGIPKGKIVRDSSYKDYVIPPCDHFKLGCSTCHYDWVDTYYRIEAAIETPTGWWKVMAWWSE
jgi:hypothetical protein